MFVLNADIENNESEIFVSFVRRKLIDITNFGISEGV
jgi:hypothetical protein